MVYNLSVNCDGTTKLWSVPWLPVMRAHRSKGHELAAGQAAGQEAAPVAARQPEEGGEELVGGVQVQPHQQLHAEDVERRLLLKPVTLLFPAPSVSAHWVKLGALVQRTAARGSRLS